MELTDYLRILRKRGWIIVVVALIAAASAYGFSKLQTPVYSATVQLSVNPARLDWGLSNTLKDLLRNYGTNIRTHSMAQKVIDTPGGAVGPLDMQSDELLSKLFVSDDASTFTLKIEARDEDPQVAMHIAQTTAEVFVADRGAWNQRQDKRDRVEVSIVDNVYNLGFQQYKPKTKVNTLAGGLFGLLVGVVVVFFLEWLEMDTIRAAEDVERAIGATVLGAIPSATTDSSPRSVHTGRRQLIPRLLPKG
ncbi:MAG: YveK family protein [Anaerolineae bacterium]